MSKIYFLTAYFEYLLDEGIRSEEYYLSDASRFLRYLLERASESDINEFLATSGNTESYKKRLRKTIRRFYRFAHEHLDVSDPFGAKELEALASRVESSII